MAVKDKYIFKDISSTAWEHPADRAALSALRKIPVLNEVLKNVLGFLNDKSLRLMALASSVRVTTTQYGELYRLHKEACMVLDTPYVPELYVSQNPFLNAGALGVNRPFVMLNTAVVEKFNTEEIQFIIGHEIGHCMSGHALYKTMLAILLRISLSLIGVPIGQVAIYALMAALREWDRKSELSSDRAGLLVIQEPEVAYSIQMKMAGGADLSKMDINEFFRQAAEYDKSDDIAESVQKLFNIIWQTHPFPVLRLTELKTWVDSGKYQNFLGGDYCKRTDDNEDIGENYKEAAKQFKEDLNRSEDPLNTAVNDFLDNINDSAEKVTQFFENFFKKK
jgi:Zn-dependent protease with chaperone function